MGESESDKKMRLTLCCVEQKRQVGFKCKKPRPERQKDDVDRMMSQKRQAGFSGNEMSPGERNEKKGDKPDSV